MRLRRNFIKQRYVILLAYQKLQVRAQTSGEYFLRDFSILHLGCYKN